MSLWGKLFLWFPVPTFWVGGIVKTIVLIASSQRAWALHPGHCVSIKLGSTLPAQEGRLLSFCCCCGVGCQPGAASCMCLLRVVKVFLQVGIETCEPAQAGQVEGHYVVCALALPFISTSA